VSIDKFINDVNTKVNSVLSNWADIHKEVPQGSILGPLLFNVFINDIFLFIKDSSLYNYADDNTLSFGSPDFDLLISTLESDSNHLIEWFKINKMQANPDKFQVLAVGKKTYEKRPTINKRLSCHPHAAPPFRKIHPFQQWFT
jgi:hypothetical protein